MADGEIGVARELATLTEAMRTVQQAVGKMDGDWHRDRTDSARSRAALYGRMDEIGKQQMRIEMTLSGQLSDVKGDVADLKKEVGDVKGVTDKVTRWQLMGIGALAVTATLASAITGVIAAFWGKITAALGW